jgi:hypothetical protein
MMQFTCPRCAKSLRGVIAFCPRCGLVLPATGNQPRSPHIGKHLKWIMFAGGVALTVALLLAYNQAPEPRVQIPSTFTPAMPAITTTTIQTTSPFISLSRGTPLEQQISSLQPQTAIFPGWAPHQVRVPVPTPVYIPIPTPPYLHTPRFDRFSHGPFIQPPAEQKILVGPEQGSGDSTEPH